MITTEELIKLCSNKKVLIWGAMIVGQGVCRSFERIGIPVEAFLDSSSSLRNKRALGYEIWKPDTSFDTVRDGKGIIVVSSGHYDFEIGEICKNEGFHKGLDYIFSRDFNNIDPSIDITGYCNLKCISCPRGNETVQPPKGCMNAATYKRVLDKLIREIPMLGSIQLYAWGEPLLNPELPEIIMITRDRKVLSAISSNLNYSKNLEEVIAARPDWFKVSCSGWNKNYEVTHTGGNWNIFLSNLKKLATLRNSYHPEMQIIVNYHLYKNNIGEDYRRMEDLCGNLSFIFKPSPAYLYPADTLMDYIDGKEISENAKRTLPLLLIGIEEGIANARKRTSLPCPEDRCLPINWDCSVRTCGIYFRPFIVENFLETPLSELLDKKRKSNLCIECKKRGIHQFTAVYLAEKKCLP